MLEQFDEKNIPQLVNRVFPLWHVENASDSFNKLYVEMIIRTNMHKNKMQFQISENDNLLAIAFGAGKKDISDNQWFESQLSKLKDSEKYSFEFGRKYLLQMEEKTFSHMNDDDVKLCLFVSLKKGYGTIILNQSIEYFKNCGFKNMYLWTDEECDVDWYYKNNYEEISKEVYEPFSTSQKKYMTYIFKKKLV